MSNKTNDAVVSVLAGILVVWLLGAYLLMIGVGMVHGTWIHALPTLSYKDALLMDLALGFILGPPVHTAASAAFNNKD